MRERTKILPFIVTYFINLSSFQTMICGDIFKIDRSKLAETHHVSGEVTKVLKEQGALAVTGFPQVCI